MVRKFLTVSEETINEHMKLIESKSNKTMKLKQINEENPILSQVISQLLKTGNKDEDPFAIGIVVLVYDVIQTEYNNKVASGKGMNIYG